MFQVKYFWHPAILLRYSRLLFFGLLATIKREANRFNVARTVPGARSCSLKDYKDYVQFK